MIEVLDGVLNYAEMQDAYIECTNSLYKINHSGFDLLHHNSSRMVSVLEENHLKSNIPFLKISNILVEMFGEIKLEDAYINAYGTHTPTVIHSDASSDRDVTVLYFANIEWSPHYGGETLFYNDDLTEVVKGVTLRSGRFVVFDSKIPHCAKSPSSNCPVNRYTIAYKLIKV